MPAPLVVTPEGDWRGLVKRYGPKFKEHMVRKMMPPSNQTVAEINREIGIFNATFCMHEKDTGPPVFKSPVGKTVNFSIKNL